MIDNNIPLIPKSEFHKCRFYIIGEDDMNDMSYVEVNNKEIFRNNLPVNNGLYNANMGTTDYNWVCSTCNNIKGICPGHFGHLNIKYPLKNPLLKDYLLKFLKKSL